MAVHRPPARPSDELRHGHKALLPERDGIPPHEWSAWRFGSPNAGAELVPSRASPGTIPSGGAGTKLVLRNYRSGSTSYIYSDPPQYAVSGTVEVEVIGTSATWVRGTIARSVATLNGPQPHDNAGYQEQRDAAQQLAFLNDPAAWTASLDLLPKEEAVLLAGLDRGRPQSRVCELMQARVAAPAQSVSSSYLYRLSEICARAHMPPAPAPAPGQAAPAAVVGVLSTTPHLSALFHLIPR